MANRVIKESAGRGSDIVKLKELLTHKELSKKQRSLIQQEIKNVSSGDAAEKRAAYLLGQFVNSGDTAYLLNDLRLEDDGNVAQIDHITINRYGVVRLFETKSFSTGIKIDGEGVFWRWDGYAKRYVEIPSPIRQSQRHETVLSSTLKRIGYNVAAIEHYVVVDYKAKLIKPKHGFDNVCRPDAVEAAICKGADNLEGIGLFVRAASMLIKKIKDEDCFNYATSLASMHKPASYNYKGKFGLDENAPSSENPPSKGNNANTHAKLTTSKLATALNMDIKSLNRALVERGYMEWRGRYLYLTEKGNASDIEFRKGAGCYYFLFPENFVISS
ncbi:MAG: hypothetical protein CMN72_00380 [Sphingomonas sp.]|nr:hypothetical protein [Sphingomonas sp.]|tara:strand:- start:10379 stop:11368 length:990 start_codon:yes stop_codon:yes gene_type:complete